MNIKLISHSHSAQAVLLGEGSMNLVTPFLWLVYFDSRRLQACTSRTHHAPAMASQPKDDQMPKLSLEELADFVADLQDLSDVNGSDLRKFNHTEYDRREQYGAFYRDFYRQLQISPDHHFKFWDGILRLARRKHLDDIKRGTPASIKNLTDLVLRGFGYIIWAETSVWLLPFDQLEDGEQPLVYLRKGGPESSANAR